MLYLLNFKRYCTDNKVAIVSVWKDNNEPNTSKKVMHDQSIIN